MERLIEIGKITPKSAEQVEKSRIGIGFEKLDRDVFNPEKAYGKVAALGVKWVRIQSGWARTEKVKGVYDFAWIDKVVDNLIARNLKPWICLCYGNGLYDEKANEIFGAVGIPPIYNEADRVGWRNYVKATVAHFKGRVSCYEIWNEPDCGYSWDHKNNGAEYGAFAAETGQAIRATDPEATIIGGAVCTRNLHFIDEALEAGMGPWIDAISFHEYTADETLVPEKVAYLKAIGQLYNPNIMVVQGESGSQSRSDGCGALRGGSWTPLKQTKQLLRHTVIDLSTDVLFTSYFSCMDMIEALNGKVNDRASYLDYGYFGVLGADFDEEGHSVGSYSPKPSYYALQNLASMFAGDVENVKLPVVKCPQVSPRIFGKDCDDPTIFTCGFRKPNGAVALAYWNTTNLMTTSFESTISFQIAGIPGEVRLVDPMNGKIYQLPENMLEHHGANRWMLRNIPLMDYPLFITIGDFCD